MENQNCIILRDRREINKPVRCRVTFYSAYNDSVTYKETITGKNTDKLWNVFIKEKWNLKVSIQQVMGPVIRQWDGKFFKL